MPAPAPFLFGGCMDLWQSFVGLLNMAVSSHLGTVMAAAALAFLVWALNKVPFVKDWVAANPKLESVATVVLAVAPALITALSSATSWADAAVTAVSTLLMSLGALAAKDKLTS
jgi:hypothetical protein